MHYLLCRYMFWTVRKNHYAYGSSGGDPSEASGAITAEHARFFPRSDVDSSLNLNE